MSILCHYGCAFLRPCNLIFSAILAVPVSRPCNCFAILAVPYQGRVIALPFGLCLFLRLCNWIFSAILAVPV